MSRVRITLAAAALACAKEAPETGVPPLYDDLGTHSHRVTATAVAQRYFDQGLRLTYAFNHAEAARSFREAARLDSTCAMCHWGVALALGPNINAAMDSASGAAAYEAVRLASRAASSVSDAERAYIEALATRYAAVPAGSRKGLDTAYAVAMARLVGADPADDDAAVLHAEAEMVLSPWDYWTPDHSPKPNAAAALSALERVISRNPNHVGACHFFIHAVEAAHPERAIPCAERLPALMPGAGHIVHMPAHIYIRVGRYNDAIESNIHAVHTDEQHLSDWAPDGVYRLAYYPHNYHFLWFAATMAGRKRAALDAARRTASVVNPSLIRERGLGALQHYTVTPLYAMVRFGDWNQILTAPAPPSDLPYPTGVWRYARALAFAAKNDVTAAESELAHLRRARSDSSLAAVTIWDLNSAAALLDIAILSASAEIAFRRGDSAAAVLQLRRGVQLEDSLVYDEPPTWHLPVRHQLGAVLLAGGRAAEAERVYREDLERHPENGWSLIGLAESLRAQGKVAAERAARERFERSWAARDVAISASRF